MLSAAFRGRQRALGGCQRRPPPSCGLRTLRSSLSSVAPIALLLTLPASARSSVLARLTTWTLFLDRPLWRRGSAVVGHSADPPGRPAAVPAIALRYIAGCPNRALA